MSGNIDNLSFAAASDAARFANQTRTEDSSSHDLSYAVTQDAARIIARDPSQGPLHNTASADVEKVTPAEANIIMSEEHKALGYRPPPGSLASEAQAVAARNGSGGRGVQREADLREAARADAARIAVERGEGVGAVPTMDLNAISKEEAARVQSEEHKRLGHRPPPGSLAAQAQSAADNNLSGNRINGGPAGINVNTMSQEDASRLMSEEHKRLGHRPPSDSLAAQVQSIVSSRS